MPAGNKYIVKVVVEYPFIHPEEIAATHILYLQITHALNSNASSTVPCIIINFWYNLYCFALTHTICVPGHNVHTW